MRRIVRTFSSGLLAIAATGLAACDTGTSQPGPPTPTNEQQTADAAATPETNAATPEASATPPAATCLFDPAKQGKVVGAQIGNIKLKQWDGSPTESNTTYELHSNCGKKKVVWMFLSAGWCGACEAYVPQVETWYQKYKDQGLEVMWIEGWDENNDPPTWEWMDAWAKEKKQTFPLLRDFDFKQVQDNLPYAGGGLPWLAVIDGNTMELVLEAESRAETETKVAEMLGVPAL